MPEDSFLKNQREIFVQQNYAVLGIDEKKLSKAIESYNKVLNSGLFGDSPYVVEDLKWTMFRNKEGVLAALQSAIERDREIEDKK